MMIDNTPGPLEFGAALGSAFTWGFASLLFARILRSDPDRVAPTAAATNLFKNTLATAVFVVLFLVRGEHLPAASAWPWLLASGVFGFAIGDSLYLAALPRTGVQVATMVSLVHVPATALFDWVVAGRTLSVVTLAWMCVVLAGVALVVTEKRPEEAAALAGPRNASLRFGILLVLCAAVSQSVGVVLGHEGMAGGSLFGGTLVRMIGGIVGALMGALLVGLVRSSMRGECDTITRPMRRREMMRPLATAALFGSVLGLPLFHFALRGLPSGVAAVLFATTPLFTLPLGFWFGERHGPRAWVGTLIGFGGVTGLVLSLG